MGRRTSGLTSAVVVAVLLPLLVASGASSSAAAPDLHERVVDITGSGTVSVQRGMTGRPGKPCPAGDRPAPAAAPHRPPEVPAGLVGVGTVDGRAPGLCRYEQAAVLALPTLDLPDGANLTAARLELEVSSLSAATEIQLTSTYADVPTDAGTPVPEVPPAASVPSAATATAAGPLQLDATAAVAALLAGDGTALLLRGVSGRALVQGYGTAGAPQLVLTYEQAAEPVDDAVPPTVSVLSPTPGESLFGDVVVEVEAADDLGVDEVSVTIGGQLVAATTAPPYSFRVDTRDLFDGEQPLVAEVRDRGGNTARAVLPVIVDNSGGPLHRLDLDLQAGRIDLDTYVLEGIRVALGIAGGSSRYAGELTSDEVTIWTWQALQTLPATSEATQAQVQEWITPVDLDALDGADTARLAVTAESLDAAAAESLAPATAVAAASTSIGSPTCGRRFLFLSLHYDCEVRTGAVRVLWHSGDFAPVASGELPDRIHDAAVGFRDAQDHMEGTLGWQGIGGVDAYVGSGGFDGRAISLPNRVIRLNRDDTEIAATSGHELVHQYQYRYLDLGDTVGPVNDRLRRIGWLMEATAEWGAHQIMASRPWNYSDNDVRTYYRNVEVFLDDPTADLMMWTVSSGRQYGAFPVLEWVEAKKGVVGVRALWEELDRTGNVPAAFRSTVDNVEVRLPEMWRDLYLLDLVGSGADQADTDLWRGELADTLDRAPYEGVGQNRPVSRTERLWQGDSAVLDVAVGPGGAELLEVDVRESQAVTVSVEVVPTEGELGVRVLPLARYDRDPQSGPELCTTAPGLTFVYDPAVCDGLSVVVASTSMTRAAEGKVVIEVGDRVDTTITNGIVRLGVKREGQLNASGFDASSGTGTTTVGLRYQLTNADALSPGCECEGWGIADVARGLGGSANQSWGGAQGLELQRAAFDAREGTSVVTAGHGAFTVTHDFYPAAETANLYEVRVTVANTTSWHALATGGYYGPLSPTYRRVMDWDVEPTAFSEFVTIGARDDVLPPEIVNATNDGFAQADPRVSATDLGARGLFTDFGPADHGALFDIALPEIDPGESYSFTMFYGAAASSASAERAIGLVDADVWSLAEPDVTDGAALGQPNTFIFALRFDRPVIAARLVEDGAGAAASAAAVDPARAPGSIARNDGVRRQ